MDPVEGLHRLPWGTLASSRGNVGGAGVTHARTRTCVHACACPRTALCILFALCAAHRRTLLCVRSLSLCARIGMPANLLSVHSQLKRRSTIRSWQRSKVALSSLALSLLMFSRSSRLLSRARTAVSRVPQPTALAEMSMGPKMDKLTFLRYATASMCTEDASQRMH